VLCDVQEGREDQLDCLLCGEDHQLDCLLCGGGHQQDCLLEGGQLGLLVGEDHLGGDCLHLDGEGDGQLLPLNVVNSGGILGGPLDKYGEGRKGEGAGNGGAGCLELQLPLTGMFCGVQLEPCHDLSAWLLSSSCVGFGGDHGSHGDGHLV
jgi:hypothetical protein